MKHQVYGYIVYIRKIHFMLVEAIIMSRSHQFFLTCGLCW